MDISNDLILQWGITQNLPTSYANYTLATTFSNTFYIVSGMCKHNGTSAGNENGLTFKPISNSVIAFQLRGLNGAIVNMPITYMVIGF